MPNFQERSVERARLNRERVIASLFCYKRAFVLSVLSVLALSSLTYTFYLSELYASELQILVEADRSDPAISSGQSLVPVNKTVTTDQVTSEVELLQGEDLLRSVVDRCNLANFEPSWRDYLNDRDPSRMHERKEQGAIKKLAARLKVKAAIESDVITLSYQVAGDNQIPACVLNTLGQAYLQKHVTLAHPVGASSFFANETERYRRQLQVAETDLGLFTSQIGEAPEVLRINLTQQLADQQAALNLAKEMAAGDTARLLLLRDQLRGTSSRIPTSITATDSDRLHESLFGTLLDLQNRRSQLLLKYAPTYPAVEEVDEEINQTRNAITKADTTTFATKTTDIDSVYQAVRLDEAKTDADLSMQKSQLKSLADGIGRIHLSIIDADQNAIKLASLQREVKAAEANYLLFLDKREQEKTSDALDTKGIANVAIAVPASVSATPKYSKIVVLLGSFVISLLGGLVIVTILDRSNNTFRIPSEIEGFLGLPVLASLPTQLSHRID